MKHTNRLLPLPFLAAALSMVASCAQAAPFTVDTGGVFYAPRPESYAIQPVYFLGGQSALDFSVGDYDGTDLNQLGGLVGALNVMGLAILPLGEPGVVLPLESLAIDPVFGDVYRVGARVSTQVGSVSLIPDGSQALVGSVGTEGGFALRGSTIRGVLTGGEARIENLRIDLPNKVVVADLSGTRFATGSVAAVSYDMPGTVLWNIASITGPATFSAAGFPPSPLSGPQPEPVLVTANNVASGLSITVAGYAFFTGALGMQAAGVSTLQSVTDYGTIKFSTSYANSIPEPSTWLMFGVGLAGISLVRRKTLAHA